MIKDEGKVVGLAGNGYYNEKLYLALKKMISYKDGNFFSPLIPDTTKGPYHKMNDYCNSLVRKLFGHPNGKAVLAFNAQLVFEECLLELVNDLHSKYPEYTSLVVSGGPFANVKANKKINELSWVKQMYIYPPMGDMGLALGAAIKKSVDLGYWDVPYPLKNLSFGLQYSNDDVLKCAKKYNFIINEYHSDNVAKLLDDGMIVGFFQGKFEYGPRALGYRSILMKATDSDGFEKLNTRLGRHEVMPFAPVILHSYADTVFNIQKSEYTAEFMTICFDTRPEWVGKIPSVVHKCDNTARPQILYKDKNPKFYEIVDEYRKVSGIPLLLNTSFNGHNEPIINSPEEAFAHLEKESIDYLVIEDFLIYKKRS
jgi:carbamoyltransferase